MKLVAVTSCPTGIAHTYMAAEALLKKATELGVEIKVETRGSVGTENELSHKDIEEAHAVILAVDTNVDESRFIGKPIVKVPISKAIKDAEEVIKQALSMRPSDIKSIKQQETAKEKSHTGSPIYKHLMTGVSNMLPLVVAGGICIALSFSMGIYSFQEEGTLAWALFQIGGTAAFGLMIAVLAGYISFSIADRPGFAPGLIGGFLANQIGAGFLGGILAGFFAGYTVKWLNDTIKLPRDLQGLKPVLLLPLLGSLIVGLTMLYIIGQPIKMLMDLLTTFLSSMSSTNMIILGLILGIMYFDLGGPVSKVAYAFCIGMMSEGIMEPMAAMMVAGMVPPIGIALSTLFVKDIWNVQQREAGKAAFVLGLCYITEGAIPFAAEDPMRVLPACIAGSSAGAIVSMLLGVTMNAPHGGIFLTLIPNAIGNIPGFFIALTVGSIVTASIVTLLRKVRMVNVTV